MAVFAINVAEPNGLLMNKTISFELNWTEPFSLWFEVFVIVAALLTVLLIHCEKLLEKLGALRRVVRRVVSEPLNEPSEAAVVEIEIERT